MDQSAALGFLRGIEPEQNTHNFTPVSAVARGVEQAHVKRHMFPVIGGHRLAFRRRVQKPGRFVSHLVALENIRTLLNRFTFCQPSKSLGRRDGERTSPFVRGNALRRWITGARDADMPTGVATTIMRRLS
jgi:hypothetical protein